MTRPIALIFIFLIAIQASAAQQGATPVDTITVDFLAPVATNIDNLADYRSGNVLNFNSKEATPNGAEFFFIRYAFNVENRGTYTLIVETSRSLRGLSTFSYVIDGGDERPVVHKRLVGSTRATKESVSPDALAAGEHTLEIRFHPEQRARLMNRVTEDWLEHRLPITGIAFRHDLPKQTGNIAQLERFALRDGDRVVFLGDSITDEEYFPGHFARILGGAFPQLSIACYNAGIGLNRATDGIARIEQDILPLKPNWVIVNYGVNDAMQFAPDRFEQELEKLIIRLRREKINVICVTPTGFHAERFPEGFYFYTRDQATALNRNAEYGAEAMTRLAQKHGCLLVDALAALVYCDIPRDRLMANQWHPNGEGGRMIALAILRKLGITLAEAQQTGDRRDAEYFKLLAMAAPVEPRRYEPAEAIAGNPTHLMLAATSYTGNHVSVYSIADRRHVATIPVGHHPLGIAYCATRDELYVACEGAGIVEVIDVKTFKRVGSIKLDDDDYPISVMPLASGNEAWIGYRHGLVKADLRTRTLGETIKVPGFAQGHALLEQHGKVLAGTSEGLAVVDLATGDVVKRLPIDNASGFVHMPDGRIVVIDTGNWQMYTLTALEIEVETMSPASYHSRAVVADPLNGLRFWVGNWRSHEIVEIRAPLHYREDVTVPPHENTVGQVEFPLGLALICRQP